MKKGCAHGLRWMRVGWLQTLVTWQWRVERDAGASAASKTDRPWRRVVMGTQGDGQEAPHIPELGTAEATAGACLAFSAAGGLV